MHSIYFKIDSKDFYIYINETILKQIH